MTNPWIKSLVTGVVCIGGGWALYCLSPAGAAEQEIARKMSEARKMYRKQATEKNE